MNTSVKKLISAALTATTALWMSGVFMLVPVASAQSTADLQAQIANLLAQIQQLQTQLTQLTQSTGGTGTAYSFTRALTVGSKGDDVSALQSYLISKGYLSISAPTAYFGPLTKAAVSAWQKANGISPSVGYFGPVSRAFYASSFAGVPGVPGVPQVAAPATGLQLGLASDNPATGSLISGSSRNRVLAVNFTAGNSGPVTITDIKLHKVGTISDSQVGGAYITESGKVLSQYSSISQGVIDFASLNLVVAAGQTREFRFAVDPTGVTAGNTVYFSIAGASDVASVDQNGNAITETGMFPLNGNIFTAASVTSPSMASLAVVTSSIATRVTAGTTNNIVGAWNFTVQNSKVYLNTLKFYVIGSAAKSDIKNLKLYVNGSQVGTALASVASDGTAYFDLSSAPATLNTGSNNVQVYADVMGSPSFTFKYEVLNGYDVLAYDSQYNVPVSVTLTDGVCAEVTIQPGTATISQYSGTPTGNVAPGQTGAVLAQFTLYAAGEAIKVKFLDFKIVATPGTSTLSNYFKNIALTDDAGGQIGTTINTPPTTNVCAANGTASYATSSGTYLDCFGTSASPINYIVPANTTRVLSLKADIQSGASFTTVVGSLVSEANNIQGLTSNALASSAGASGSSLTLSTAILVVAQNNAFGSQNYVANSANKRIGSYSFTASTADSVTLNSITVTVGSAGGGLANLKLYIGGNQFGTTQSTLSNSQGVAFSGSAVVPKGGTATVDVYADLLSSAAAMSPATTLSGCSGYGTTYLTSVSCGSTAGQNLAVAAQSGVVVGVAQSYNPLTGQVAMLGPNSQVSLAAFNFTETSGAESVKINSLNVIDAVAGGTSTTTVKAAFSNLQLYSGSQSMGTANTPVVVASTTVAGVGGWLYTFNFSTPVIVPSASSLALVLKGDPATWSSSGATDNSTHVFKIATTTDSTNNTAALVVVAVGQSSNASSAVTISGGASFPSSTAAGNTQTVLRTVVGVAGGTVGATTGRGKTSGNDVIGSITFSANSAGGATLNSVTVTFSGSTPSVATFLPAVDLTTDSAGAVSVISYGAASSTSAACTGGTTNCAKGWYFGANASGWGISAGGTATFYLVVKNELSNTYSTGGQNAGSALGATISANTDVMFTDAPYGSTVYTTGLSPASTALTSLVVSSIQFATGQ